MIILASRYLQQTDLKLDDWDKRTEIGLIAAPCGLGKTHASVHWLPQFLGFEPRRTLLLSPRAAIRDQTLETYDTETVPFSVNESAFGSDDRVRVTTVHQIGRWYRSYIDYPKPNLVIVDEFHSLFSENVFAQDLIYFYQQLLEWAEDPSVCVLVLTATTTLPLQFVNKCPFEGFEWIYESFKGFKIKSICGDLEPRYKVAKVQIESGKSLETVLRQCPASPDKKQLIFTRGRIERLANLADADKCASWLCSVSSRSEIGGEKASDLMNREHYDSLIGGYLPEGINRIYLSSAYREGLNVHDEAVREVIIEGASDIEIVQALGRVRHSIDRMIVVVDARKFPSIDGNVRNALALLKSGDLKSYYDQQNEQEKEDYEGEKVPILVYEDIRTQSLRFNFLALCYWLFDHYSVTCATQRKQTEIVFSGSELPRKIPYFEGILKPYSEAKIKFDLISFGKPNLEQENREKIERFDWASWRGRELYGVAAEVLVKELDLYNRDYSRMALSGIYALCPDKFEGKYRRKRDGKRQTVYVVA